MIDEDNAEELIRSIKRNGKKASGRNHLLRHLKGGKLTRKQAMEAKCYDCMGYCADGRLDCEMPECSMYGFHPWKKD